jgi:thiosulfate reductase/polysulfide reductase chain A
MSSTMAPNVHGVGGPGRRTVYSMCGMCAVRCPMEVTVEDGRVAWIQGNPRDEAIGASLCAKGAAGLAFEFDDQRPQTPLVRKGPRGGGQWRRASWDEALDYVADKLKQTIEAFGPRGIVLSDRGGPFADLTKTFLQALGSPNYFNHDACGGNVLTARSIYLQPRRLIFDLKNTTPRALWPQHRQITHGEGAQGFMSAMATGCAAPR